MNQNQLLETHLRRDFLRRSLAGIGTLALSDLLSAAPVADPLAPKAPHYKAKAKNVIFLFQEGAPSQMDLFDQSPNSPSGTGNRCLLR